MLIIQQEDDKDQKVLIFEYTDAQNSAEKWETK